MEKKSIGIITIHKSIFNYGGALQCFALYEYLKSLGYSVEVIDLLRPNDANYIHSYKFPIMRQPISAFSVVKGFIKELLGIKRLRKPKAIKQWGNRESARRFEQFNNRIKYSRTYNYIPDLYKRPPIYDIYISGSDQLWNPSQYYCLEPYFLTFVKNKNAKKLSYGTSIGLSDIREDEKNFFRKWLETYDCISVRERQAQLILAPLVKQKVFRVPDPTFLLDPMVWCNMSNLGTTDFDDDYILVFSLRKEQCIYNKAMEIGATLGWRVKILDPRGEVNVPQGAKLVDDAGPLEFIDLIRKAKLVLTDSFHCTVFSLIVESRNFYTYIAPNVDRGSRIVDLLDLYNLSGHIVYSMDDIPTSECLKEIELEHTKIRKTMDYQRELGREFLKAVI